LQTECLGLCQSQNYVTASGRPASPSCCRALLIASDIGRILYTPARNLGSTFVASQWALVGGVDFSLCLVFSICIGRLSIGPKVSQHRDSDVRRLSFRTCVCN